MIDYAYPCMMAENALKKLHDAMLMKKYDDAIEQGIIALAETKMIINSIRHMKEQENGLRQDRKSTRLNSSHVSESRMPSSA